MKKTVFCSVFIALAILTSCKKDEFKGQACFTYSPDSDIEVGDVVAFSNCSSDAGFYMWNFGDNTTSTEKNPSHSYTEPSTYTVSLAVQDDEFIDLNGDGRINQLDRYADSDLLTATIIVVPDN